jgi:hypothetical protein
MVNSSNGPLEPGKLYHIFRDDAFMWGKEEASIILQLSTKENAGKISFDAKYKTLGLTEVVMFLGGKDHDRDNGHCYKVLYNNIVCWVSPSVQFEKVKQGCLT